VEGLVSALRLQMVGNRLFNVNPGLINPVYGCLIERVPFKYQIMTIGRIPP
jgi:hypothetical protein